MEQPKLEFILEIKVRVAPALEIGKLAEGQRRIIDIHGGEFAGPKLRGSVKPGGADWQLIRADSVTELDARYTLLTDEGKPIYVSNRGIRYATPEITAKLAHGERVDAGSYYFWSTPSFETAEPSLQWMRRAIFVGEGTRLPELVIIKVWRVG